MDVQKVAAQSAAGTPAPGQRNEDGGKGAISSFVDLIRKPILLAGADLDPFATRSRDAGAARESAPEPALESRADRRDDTPRSDSADDYEAPARGDASEAREDNQSAARDDDNNRAEKSAGQEDKRESADSDRPTENGGESDKNGAQQAETDSDGDTARTEGEGGDAAAAQAADTDGTVSDDRGASENMADPALAMATAIHEIRNQTQDGIRTAARDAALAVAAAAQASNAGQGDEAAQAEQNALRNAADPAFLRSQNADQTAARVGLAASNAADAAAKAGGAQQPSLAEQQAKAMSEQLKSQDPINIRVRESVRGAQSAPITANAESSKSTKPAADVSEALRATTTPAKPITTRPDGGQAANARTDASQAQAQAQAQAQLAKGIQNAAAEDGLSRAATRVGGSGMQSATAAEASNGSAQTQNQTQQTSDVQRAAQSQTARQSAPAKPIVQQITVNISKAIAEGLDRINIQLRPEELGRVEVRLEVNQNGRVNAQVIVDRPETLELLRNDSRNLEKALQDAGFDTEAGDLSFDLRQQDQDQNPDAEGNGRVADGGVDNGDAEAELAQMLINGEPLSIIRDDRVDIRA